MADLSIRKDFVDGIYDVFATLFNDGVSDGVKLYLLSDKTTTNVYGENKYKMYKEPILLVAKAQLTPTLGGQDVETIKDKAIFTIPLKAFEDNNLGVTNKDLDELRKGVIEFHNVFYTIDNISPKAYIEDVFLMYQFDCTEDKNTSSILVEEKEEDTENKEEDTEIEVPSDEPITPSEPIEPSEPSEEEGEQVE